MCSQVWAEQSLGIFSLLTSMLGVAQAVPLIAKLRDLVRRRNDSINNGHTDLPAKVLLVWASRNVEEFTALDLPLLSALR